LAGITPILAQSPDSDLTHIENVNFDKEKFEPRQVTFLFANRPDLSPIIRYNPLTLTLGGLMYTYQKVISPQISSKCSYQPTCSRFSVAAIQKYGFIKGLALSADRLCRCSPIAAKDISFTNIDKEQRKVVNKPEKYQLYPNK
jgi:putative membrane protein insertion efficiency factor